MTATVVTDELDALGGPTTPSRPWSERNAPHVAFAVAVVVLVSAPLLFTDWTNTVDFTNGLWYGSVREWQIVHGQLFNYYLQDYPTGLFYPFFAFYGGGLFTAAGALSALLGDHTLLAFDVVGVGAFSAAYGGSYWLGRQCGLTKTLAHAPALTVVTSAYFVTDLYGRGDWPEFVAVCSLPLLVASGASILRSTRLRFAPTLGFLAAEFFTVGSHPITLTWGVTMIAIATAGLLVVYRWRVPLRRWLALGGVAAIGVLVNAWYLGPLLAYSGRVHIAFETAPLAPANTSFFDTFSVLFDPLRSVPAQSTTPALFVQAPDWFLAWALLVLGALVLTGRGRSAARALLVLVPMLGAVLWLILNTATIDLPDPWRNIQFPYRLNAYLVLLVAGMVVLAGAGIGSLERPYRRLAAASLAVVAAVSLGLCTWQLFVPVTEQSAALGPPSSLATRAEAFTGVNDPPETFEAYHDYADATGPEVFPAAGRHFWFPLTSLSSDDESLTETVTLPAGTAPIETNIAAGPEFVTFSGGVHRVGDDAYGLAVIARNAPGSGPLTVTVTETHGLLDVLPAASVAGAAAGLVLLGWLGTRDLAARRRSRRGGSGIDDAPEGAAPVVVAD